MQDPLIKEYLTESLLYGLEDELKATKEELKRIAKAVESLYNRRVSVRAIIKEEKNE